MTMPAKASHAAGRCFELFCIEDHPKAGEVFADLLASEARGETVDLPLPSMLISKLPTAAMPLFDEA